MPRKKKPEADMPALEALSKPLQLPVRWVSKGGGKQFAYLSGECVIQGLNNGFRHDGWE